MQTPLTSRALPVEPLTAERFQPFGDVIEVRGDAMLINQGRCQKFNSLTRIETDNTGKTGVHLYHTQAIEQPYRLDLLERHPLGSQAFMPLEKQRFLIVVAKSQNNQPDLDTIRCFLANGSQGITYHRGVWHHPLLSIDEGHSFLVIDRIGPGQNCDEVLIPQSMAITVGGDL